MGSRARHEDGSSAGERKHLVAVLQQGDALQGCSCRGGLKRLALFGREHGGQHLAVLLQQAQGFLHGQDASHTEVDARFRNLPLFHQFTEQDGEFQVFGHHAHVYACVDGHADRFFVVRRHLVPLLQKDNVLPIGQHDTLEPELSPKDVCEHEPVGVRGDAVHFAAVDHDTHGASLHSLGKRRQKHLPQLTFRNVGRRPVLAAPRHAVPEVVLEGGRHLDVSFLKPANHGHAHVAHELGILAERLPEARPAGVSAHVQHRGKIPRDATRMDFFGCPLRHFTNQRGVPRRSQGQLLWPQGRTVRVRCAMDGVHPVQRRNPFGVHAGLVNGRDK